ncbi:hypothetical protein Acid7E03_38900 [Acidisoma sp. 7E03]
MPGASGLPGAMAACSEVVGAAVLLIGWGPGTAQTGAAANAGVARKMESPTVQRMRVLLREETNLTGEFANGALRDQPRSRRPTM